MVFITDEMRDTLINFGCALVQSGLAQDYGTMQDEPVPTSLLEALGATRQDDYLTII